MAGAPGCTSPTAPPSESGAAAACDALGLGEVERGERGRVLAGGTREPGRALRCAGGCGTRSRALRWGMREPGRALRCGMRERGQARPRSPGPALCSSAPLLPPPPPLPPFRARAPHAAPRAGWSRLLQGGPGAAPAQGARRSPRLLPRSAAAQPRGVGLAGSAAAEPAWAEKPAGVKALARAVCALQCQPCPGPVPGPVIPDTACLGPGSCPSALPAAFGSPT